MPLRRSSLPFNVGIDIVYTTRFTGYTSHKHVNRHRLPRFLDKVFTEPEQTLFRTRFPYPSRDAVVAKSAARYLASRWAAKEAVIKAFRARRLFMLDVEIHSHADKSPYAVVLDRRRTSTNKDTTMTAPSGGLEEDTQSQIAACAMSNQTGAKSVRPALEEMDGEIVNLSISHEDDVCVATAIAKAPMPLPTAKIEDTR